MRKSFTLILTIFFLIIFSSLTAMILSLSADTGSTTTRLYLYNQAKLLARSGNEIAVLMIQNRFSDNICLENLEIQDGDFNISINISYIGSGFKNCKTLFSNSYQETNGTVIIDVYVTTTFKMENINFHRRTAQKP